MPFRSVAGRGVASDGTPVALIHAGPVEVRCNGKSEMVHEVPLTARQIDSILRHGKISQRERGVLYQARYCLTADMK